jgi:hypothetical protein
VRQALRRWLQSFLRVTRLIVQSDGHDLTHLRVFKLASVAPVNRTWSDDLRERITKP